MTRTRYDYVMLETEFVKSELSVRELARRHGIPDSRVSVIHAKAKQLDMQGRTWYDKREEFQNRSTNKTLELLADKEAKRRLRESEVVDDAIELVHEAIRSATESLQVRVDITQSDGTVVRERKYRVEPKDVVNLIDRISTLFRPRDTIQANAGGVNLGANLNVNVAAPPELGAALLSELVESSRGRSGVANARPVGGSSLPSAEDAR